MCETHSDDQFDKQVKKAISASCRILAIREHSVKELRLKLDKKGFISAAVNKAIEWVLKENWLSEERFCGSYIRGKAAKGQGRLRIESELQQQGIDELLIAKSFSEEEVDWLNSCLNVANKKLASLVPHNYTRLEIAELSWQQTISIKVKLERFLRYRGFSNSEIKTTIKQCFSKQEFI